MRRLLGTVAVAVLLAIVGLLDPSPSLAATTTITGANMPLLWVTGEPFSAIPVTAQVTSDEDVTAVTVRFRMAGITEPFETVPLTLESGTVRSGRWSSDRRVETTGRVGLVEADYIVVTTSGAVTTKTTTLTRLARETQIVDLSDELAQADPEHLDLTLRGRVLFRDDAGALQPVQGGLVRLISGNEMRATAETGVDGRFALTGRFTIDESWSATYDLLVPQQGELYGRRITGRRVDEARRPSRVTVDKLPTGQIAVGTTVTITGRVDQQNADGTWAVSPSRSVFVFAGDPLTGMTGTTGPDGRFKVAISAMQDGLYGARASRSALNADSGGSSYPLDVAYQARISSFNASPEPVAKGKTITVSGTLQRYVSAWGPLGGKTVYLYFRPYKATAWTYMGVATSDKYGKWHRGFTASRDGTWYAKYKGSDTYLPVTSGGDYVDVR